MYLKTSNNAWISSYKKGNYHPKKFLEKYNLNKDAEVHSNNSLYVDFDEEYYDEKCQGLILDNLMMNLFFKEIRKIIIKIFELRALKFLSEI